MKLPAMYEVCQKFDNTCLTDPAAAIDNEFSKHNIRNRALPGEKVAVGVGSRGIHNISLIVAAVIKNLRELGLEPFITPAMGSHGGATAQGQIEVLKELGITEKSVNAPLVSNMDVEYLGRVESGASIFIAKDILEADHLVLINRVKPHTAFRSSVESGLCKMLAVGCGKHKGASEMHKYSLASTIIPAAKMIMDQVPILCGLAVVENSLEQIHTLRLALPEDFIKVDQELLELSRELMPKIPVSDLDILIINEMGKNISGAGIDPNVIGFWRRNGGERVPDYRTLIVLDLTRQSHGNALGIGMADLTTRRVVEKINYEVTYTNVLTTGIWATGRIPVSLEDDRKAVETALAFVPEQKPLRMARITNTLKLEKFWVTKPLILELQSQDALEIKKGALDLQFDNQGRIIPF